jgi:hypothetical protein
MVILTLFIFQVQKVMKHKQYHFEKITFTNEIVLESVVHYRVYTEGDL